MITENEQFLLRLAQWLAQQERKVVSEIRERAETEENYLIFIREHDRVQEQVARARSLQTRATLTLTEWLTALVYFRWRCAYCQEKPFQVLHHFTPRSQGGTSSENCVPACYSCVKSKARRDTSVKAYLADRKKGPSSL
jgi:5-methylcytosine-specific restriction endonuclease McrA